jgi:4-hydroxy-3-polyprenylbenzoate decarboxylase
VIRVKAIYHRSNPIILSQAPMWPGTRGDGLAIGDFRGGVRDLQNAGIQDVVAVGSHMGYIRAISIRQAYPGHAKQAAMASLASTRNGRWIVVVDEDIDPRNLKEVLWAMTTRCDPARDIETVEGCWSTPLDPLVSADHEKIAKGDHTNSIAIFYACRPFHQRDTFPKPSRSPREMREQVIAKYRDVLPFPGV